MSEVVWVEEVRWLWSLDFSEWYWPHTCFAVGFSMFGLLRVLLRLCMEEGLNKPLLVPDHILGAVEDLCYWGGLGFWRCTRLWAVVTHRDASIVGKSKFYFGVTTWVYIVITGGIGAFVHRDAERHCAWFCCLTYSDAWQGLWLVWRPGDVVIPLTIVAS